MSQQNMIDSLTLTWGRVCVRDGYADDHITVTIPNGREYTINEDGRTTKVGVNFSIDWSL